MILFHFPVIALDCHALISYSFRIPKNYAATQAPTHPRLCRFRPPGLQSPAMNRDQLIARKHEVIAAIQRARSELERRQQEPSTWRGRRQIAALENRLDQLMAEEYRLRLQIDQTR